MFLDSHIGLGQWTQRSLALLAVLLLSFNCLTVAQTKKFEPVEATIADIHRAFRSGKLTCRQLVEAYLKRIATYDQVTKLNAIVVINPNALAEADKLDAEFKRTKKLRPLHGIPVIVKDNFDTKDLQTTGGSAALKGSIPPDDAFQVRKIREAGAIVLAKSNMDESDARIKQYEMQLRELEQKRQQIIESIHEKWAVLVNQVSEIQIPAKKADVFIEYFGVAWQPYYLIRAAGEIYELPGSGVE